MSDLYPWDLSTIPHYDQALDVSIEDVSSLTPNRFIDRYVRRNRPCLIKGAVKGWKAVEKWQSLDFIKAKIGDMEVRVSSMPKVERFGLRSEERDSLAGAMTKEQMSAPIPVWKVLDDMQQRDGKVSFFEVRPTNDVSNRLGEDLSGTEGRFPFLPDPPAPKFFYSVWAAMFYKNSYSDWHFHPGTEAIMCQVLGTKDVALLPPSRLAWQQILPVHVGQLRVYGVNLNEYPQFGHVRPIRATVEPGDGLYIPVNWWHAVQARPDEFGVTVPLSWQSDYQHLAHPATRHFLTTLWKRNKPLAAYLLATSISATVRAITHETLTQS